MGTMQGLISELTLSESESLDGWQGSAGASLRAGGARPTETAPGSGVLTADPTRVAVDPILHVTVACLC